jgi:hypothetical protein
MLLGEAALKTQEHFENPQLSVLASQLKLLMSTRGKNAGKLKKYNSMTLALLIPFIWHS